MPKDAAHDPLSQRPDPQRDVSRHGERHPALVRQRYGPMGQDPWRRGLRRHPPLLAPARPLWRAARLCKAAPRLRYDAPPPPLNFPSAPARAIARPNKRGRAQMDAIDRLMQRGAELWLALAL